MSSPAFDRVLDFLFARPETPPTVVLRYESSHSGTTMEVTGTMGNIGFREWTDVVTDEGVTYRVCNDDLDGRDRGDVLKDGHRVGTFLSADHQRP